MRTAPTVSVEEPPTPMASPPTALSTWVLPTVSVRFPFTVSPAVPDPLPPPRAAVTSRTAAGAVAATAAVTAEETASFTCSG